MCLATSAKDRLEQVQYCLLSVRANNTEQLSMEAVAPISYLDGLRKFEKEVFLKEFLTVTF